MTFTAEQMKPQAKFKKPLKANYPFAAMKANPGTGFIIPVDREDLFQHCRVLASIFNKSNGTKIVCNKQRDGSLRVWNEHTESYDNTIELLEQSIAIVEQKKEDSQAPTKDQFIHYLTTDVLPGMSITLQKEYAHRFVEFQLWASELQGFETAVTFNPPSLKITRKGN